jgi:tetratricopeptide (TPR) repeat protein
MIRRFSIATLCAVVLSLCACSSATGAIGPTPVNRSFAAANQAYLLGRYSDAVRDYRALLTEQGYSAGVLFNLGNTWMRLNQPGRAILSYERALWLEPGNQAIAHNLQVAQRQSGVAVTRPAMLDHTLPLIGFNTLAWVGTVAAVVLCLCVLVALARRPTRLAPLRSTAALSALVMFAAFALLAWRWPDLRRAVVISEATPAHIAPAAAADVSFRLKPGEQVELGRRYADYVLVHDGDGRTGWVSASQVAKIVTRAGEYEASPTRLLTGQPTSPG